MQAQVQQVEGRVAETARKIADSETALSSLKNDMARLSGNLPVTVADPKLADQKRGWKPSRRSSSNARLKSATCAWRSPRATR